MSELFTRFKLKSVELRNRIARALGVDAGIDVAVGPDGELRAQVRHLLRRAEALMNGGYLALAGVSHAAATHPGDEPLR